MLYSCKVYFKLQWYSVAHNYWHYSRISAGYGQNGSLAHNSSFLDAGRYVGKAQLSSIPVVFVAGCKHGSIFQALSLFSHRSRSPVRSPVKSTSVARSTAAGESIDKWMTISSTLFTCYPCSILLWISVYSKKSFATLSTERNSIGKSVRGDLCVVCY